MIENGVIVDGTGNPWFKANIGIDGGRITRIGRVEIGVASQRVDAKDLIIAPGFIDTHAHSDFTALEHNKAESVISAGITTLGVGNCGLSVFPVTNKNREYIQRWILDFGVDEADVQWTSLAEWRKRIETKGIGSNLAPYAGHNTLRCAVMGIEGQGGERFEPTEDEIKEMKRYVDQAMRDGAFGLSSGLPFPPGRNALTYELIELCKVIAKYGGFYTSHMRDTTDKSIEAAMEFIAICEKAGVRGLMSHLYSGFAWNHGKPIAILRLIDRARARGVDIAFDFVPYAPLIDGCFLGVQFSHLPGVSFEEGLSRRRLLEELKDPEKWKQMKRKISDALDKERLDARTRGKGLQKRGLSWAYSENEIHLIPQLKYMIAYSRTKPSLHGKTLEEAARLSGESDYLEFARDLFLADEGYTTCGGNDVSEEDVIALIKHPLGSICSDTWQYDFSKVPWSAMTEKLEWFYTHSWAHSHFLEKYVREEKVLALEKAVAKMTSLPARALNLKDRGTLQEGNWADITIFDFERIKQNATWANPTIYPSGILYVVVNGEIVLHKGKHTEELPGKVLFHQP